MHNARPSGAQFIVWKEIETLVHSLLLDHLGHSELWQRDRPDGVWRTMKYLVTPRKRSWRSIRAPTNEWEKLAKEVTSQSPEIVAKMKSLLEK